MVEGPRENLAANEALLQKVKQDDLTCQGQGFDENDLVPLHPSHFDKIKFPPTCPIVYTDFQKAIPEATYGIVETGFVHLGTPPELVYRLKGSNQFVLKESEMVFGRGAPVWAVPPGGIDPVAAVILNACIEPNDHEVFYSVQVVNDGYVIHFLFAASIKYRRLTPPVEDEQSDEASNQSTEPESSEPQEHSSASLIDADVQSRNVVVAECLGENCCHDAGSELPMENFLLPDGDLLSQSSSAPQAASICNGPDLDERVGSAGDVSTCTSLPHDELHTNVRRSSMQESFSAEKRRPSQSSQDVSTDHSTGTKRQKIRDQGGHKEMMIRRSLVLPFWVNVSRVNAIFYKSKLSIEKATNCRIFLRGGTDDKAAARPALPYVTYFDVDGPDSAAIDSAFCHIEDILADLVPTNNERCILLHDIAQCSRDYYHYDKELVFQRDITLTGNQWRWMVIIDLPKELCTSRGKGIMVGPKGRGTSEIEGGTDCRIRVCSEPRGCVHISGAHVGDVEKCAQRTLARITWAQQQRKHLKP